MISGAGTLPYVNWKPSMAAPSLAAWFRWGVGITEAGAGVSQWDDQSGNAVHLKQATDTNRPAKQADGSILFDGVDNFLKCDSFTLNFPETVTLLFNQVSWTSNDYIFDGNTDNSGALSQKNGGASPELSSFQNGPATPYGTINGPAVGTYGIVTCVFNAGNSMFYLNNAAPTTGSGGVLNMSGFTLGRAGASGIYANIQVKEAIVRNVSDARLRLLDLRYLASVGGIQL